MLLVPLSDPTDQLTALATLNIYYLTKIEGQTLKKKIFLIKEYW